MSDTLVDTGRARVRLMGEFKVVTPEGRHLSLINRRARALIGYLSLTPGHSASRTRLAGLLWSDRGELQARASLRQCLLDTRAAADAVGLALLDVSRERVALTPDILSTDVDQLAAAIRNRDLEATSGLLETIGAQPLLDGLELNGLYREWLDQTRVRFDQSIAAAIAGFLERLEARAAWSAVSRLAGAYLLRDPLNEGVVATAIRADAAMGNATVARRRFQVLEGALAAEFGVRPGARARGAMASLGGAGSEGPGGGERGTDGSRSAGGAEGPMLVIVAAFGLDDQGPAARRLADILRDETLAGLARFHGLRIVVDPRPVDLVSLDLRESRSTAYALGATLRTIGQSWKLLVKLVHCGEGDLVWSHQFMLPDLDLVAQIDDIIAPVVAAVFPSISADLLRRPVAGAIDRTYERHLLALGPGAKAGSFEEARSAASSLEAMIAASPTYGRPYLPLCYLYNTDFDYTRAGSSGPAEWARAFDLAKTALALDRRNVQAYSATGWCYLRRRQWDPALRHFEQALAMNPYDVSRLTELGFGFLFLGDVDRARSLLDRCLILNPAPDDTFFNDLGLISLMRGDHGVAQSYLELSAAPDLWGDIYRLINAEIGGFDTDEPLQRAMSQIRAIWPADRPLTREGILGWIAAHHPFRDPAMAERFFSTADRALRALPDQRGFDRPAGR